MGGGPTRQIHDMRRRQFLGTAGVGSTLTALAALAPQLAQAHPSSARRPSSATATAREMVRRAGMGVRHAAGLGVPKRLVLIPMLNGTPKGTFWPEGGGAWPMVSAPLEPFKSKIQFVQGLDQFETHDHIAIRTMFTGAKVLDYSLPLDMEVASVDQILGSHFMDADPTRRRSIHLSACPADHILRYKLQGRATFYFTETEAVDYFANPANAFDSYFPKTDGGDDSDLIELRKRVLAITEAELGDLRAVLGDSELELAKLGTHAASIDVLQAATDAGGGTCDGGPIPTVEAIRSRIGASEEKAYNQAHYSDLIDAQLDIIVRALACGLTRVATMQWNSADGNVGVPIAGGARPHHDTSHGNLVQFAECQRWYAEKVARLLTALDAEIDPLDPSGTATLLDNTCVVWMAECNPDHGSWDIPMLYAGGWGGALATGSTSKFDFEGATNRHFLKTLCNVAGVPKSASAQFGDDDLPELVGSRA